MREPGIAEIIKEHPLAKNELRTDSPGTTPGRT